MTALDESNWVGEIMRGYFQVELLVSALVKEEKGFEHKTD